MPFTERLRYDANGNQTARTESSVTETLAYDYANRLVSYSKPGVSYSYMFAPTGERLNKHDVVADTTEWFRYDGQDVTADYSQSGSGSLAHTRSYVQSLSIDSKLARIEQPSGDELYYVPDALGSATHILDGTQAIVRSETTDAWGNILASAGTPDRRGLTQREKDSESSLMHYRARSYDPRVGRFLQVDPLLSIRISQHYVAVHNTPTERTDRTGRQSEKEIEAAVKTRNPRLAQEYEFLQKRGWRLSRQQSGWFDNYNADATNQLVIIDDDEVDMDTALRWFAQAVRYVYSLDDDARRDRIRSFADEWAAKSRAGTATALQGMAQVFEQAAWFQSSTSTYANDIGLVLTGQDIGSVPVPVAVVIVPIVVNVPRRAALETWYIGDNAWGERLGSTGFRRTFRDNSNQVRHAAAVIALAAQADFAGITADIREWWEGGEGAADYRLNKAATSLGNRLYSGKLKQTRHGSTKGIADAIGDELGDLAQTQPWTREMPADGDPN